MATDHTPRPPSAARSIFPRWLAGVAAIGVGLVSSSRLSLTSVEPGPRPATTGAVAAVVRHPDPARPLKERWEWARSEALRLGARAVWIGYHVRSSLLVDLRGLALPGPCLADLVGPGERSDDMAVLFRVTASGPMRVHVGGFLSPLDASGETLFWLGAAEDGASLTRLQTLFAEAATADLKENLVAAVGLHGSTAVVVPLLERWSAGSEPWNVRAEAATWLRHHGRSAERAPAPLAPARPRDPDRGHAA